MASGRGLVAAAALGVALLWVSLGARTAVAEIAPELELGLGLVTSLGGSFLDQPTDKAQVPGGAVSLVYPGFAGVGGGGGLSLELRWRQIFSVELNLLLSLDRGAAYIDLVRVEIGQTAWHVPVLFKAVYPGERLKPWAGLGFAVVQPVALEANTAPLLPETATRIGSQAGTYGLLQLAVGLEILLPIDDVDLRVPLGLRGAWNPGSPDAARDRAAYTFRPQDPLVVDTVIFSSEWQYHLGATLGLAVYF